MSPVILSLVVVAAFIHASWNILLKRVQGGLSFLWCVDILQTFVFAPWVAWVIWQNKSPVGYAEWFFILGSAVIHIGYYFFLQRGYRLAISHWSIQLPGVADRCSPPWSPFFFWENARAGWEHWES
ncbi:MAG TPA: hypothetical protein VFO40_07975 [Chthoniobacterales bacterium]|nr:hypothetical protein [Chthoniobacterales bacterium]